MSHTINIATPQYGNVTVHHNSDWSGNVTIVWAEKKTGEPDLARSVEVPGEILVQLGLESAVDVVRDKVFSALEDI